MSEKIGIKETIEALAASNEIAIFVAHRLKDGVGVDDAMAVFQKLVADPEFKAKVALGFEKISEVPAELKDLDLLESVQLVQAQISYLPKFKEALAK